MRDMQTDVLVVGSGPVGLWTALKLAEAGAETTVIDQQTGTAARSYACALHPRSLRLLDQMELARPLIEEGIKVSKFAFYSGDTRRAEIQFKDIDGEFPFLLIVPQNILESSLERKLTARGVRVKWQHRFDTFRMDDDEVESVVEELGGTSTGYIVPHWEMTVRNRFNCRSRFIVGADGHNSLVRQRADLGYELIQAPQAFAAFEFESETPAEPEVRVIMDGQSINVLWPLPGNRYRWTFQMVQGEGDMEFPEKERRAVRVARTAVDERIVKYVERLAHKRAPWFKAPVKEITWCTEVAFAQQVARHFTTGRCWLAGDAAHQTGPAGVQSMNAGFVEMEEAAPTLARLVRQEAGSQELVKVAEGQKQAWVKLLSGANALKASPGTDPWMAEQRARILPCLPGFGEGLARVARQLKLEF